MRESSVKRLVSLFEAGALVPPNAGALNAVDLARALAVIAGAPAFEDEVSVLRITAIIGEPRHLVFVLVDGLGMNLVERLPADAFLRRHLKIELTAVFPSSTAPALTSLATGLWPSAHAVPAWFTYLPRYNLTSTVLPFIERRSQRALSSRRVPSEYVFPAPTSARFFRRDFKAFQPSPIANSVYTRYMTAGPPAQGYQALGEAIDAVAARVRAAALPTYTYFYWPQVDAAEHDHGAHSREAWHELLRLDSELARLKDGLGDAATIVVSADHGQITVPEHLKSVINDSDELQEVLRVWPPSGEPRCVFFHVQPGRKAAFVERFERRFEDAFVLLSTDEAESLRLFGAGILSPEARARIGDFIAIPEGAQALGYGGEQSIVRMKGFHAALSPDEMRIPLVVA